MIRILLVDDQTIFCQALQTWLNQISDLQVVGIAHHGQAAIEQAERLQPDIVLIDIEMPGMNGIEAARIIGQRLTKPKVIMLSSHDGEAYIKQAVQAGAKGYLLKNTNAEDLAATIRAVYQGYGKFGPGLLEKIAVNVSSTTAAIASPIESTALAESGLIVLPEPEFLHLLQQFDGPILVETVQQVLEHQASLPLLTRLNQFLKTEPTNLAALYLVGALAHRGQNRGAIALQYLRFGFRAGMQQQRSPEELLLFYQEGTQINPKAAFGWLTQPQSPWNQEAGLEFLQQEAARIFGQDSLPYRRLQVRQQIRGLNQLSQDCIALKPGIEALQQWFIRLNQVIER